MATSDKIKLLEDFKALLLDWERIAGSYDTDATERAAARSRINRDKSVVRQIVIEAHCLKRLTIGPPPALGGLIVRDVDPFAVIFDPPYGRSVISVIMDMLDEAIGVLEAEPEGTEQDQPQRPLMNATVVKNYAFVAMPMDPKDHRLADVLDAIKEAARRCDVQAERVDEPASNDRITDRILESIRKAEFVIADLTDSRPNVYFEAGYAHGLGKTPIYIAREETKLEFDLKDYPVIFFKSFRELKDELERRLRGIAASQRAT